MQKISDNTLKLLKRAAKLDYSTPWKPVPDNEPLATGDLVRLLPAINTDPYFRRRYNDSRDYTNGQVYHSVASRSNNRQYFPYYALTLRNKTDTLDTYYANKPVKKP